MHDEIMSMREEYIYRNLGDVKVRDPFRILFNAD